MTKLATLRSQLSALRHRRSRMRRLTAFSAAAVAALWAILAVYVVDVNFVMTPVQRLVAMALAVVGLVWALRRYTLPWLGQHENDLDMALLVERQQRIDTSDLVAALQFESAAAPSWGSTQLQTAVVDYVADFSRGWNVYEGFSRRPLLRRAGILLATVALIVAGVVFYSDYAAVFAQRMLLLGHQHYPTAVQIARIEINGVPNATKSAEGQPLRFKVTATARGKHPLPEVGRVELSGKDQEGVHPIELTKKTSPDNDVEYVGELAQLLSDVSYQVYLDDDWTEKADLKVIPLPQIDLKLTGTPPEYAKNVVLDPEVPGSRQLTVLENSAVDMQLLTNKPLKSATLTIDGKEYPLKKGAGPTPDAEPARDSAAKDSATSVGHMTVVERWSLKDPESSPLAMAKTPLNYEVSVVDDDGLRPEHPLQGAIRIKPDRKPTITAAVIATAVLPTGTPRIGYLVNDDFGVAKVVAHVQVLRQGQATDGEPEMPPIVITEQRTLAGKLPLKGAYPLPLPPLNLVKGDQLRIKLEAWDYRGAFEGKSTESETLLLTMTDEVGFLEGITQSDIRSASDIDKIIKLYLIETGAKK